MSTDRVSQTDKTLCEFEAFIKNMPRSELAGLIKEYVGESNHNGWDGHPKRDVYSYAKLFADLMAYHKGSPEGHFTQLSNVSPVE